MARMEYYVLSNGDRWTIRHDGRDYHYNTQAEAIRNAVDAAHQAGRTGHDAQVLVQSHTGAWRTEWTYGHDPYPPRG